MQVLDPLKRLKILDVAAERFAAQPFHKVLLSDVAEAAGVGKGTLYTYFKNKDDLYLSVLYNGFSQLIDQLQQKVDQNQQGPLENLETVVREIVRFACQNPYLYELMRSVPWCQVTDNALWNGKRTELRALIEAILRRGIALGEFEDPHPELTARFIPHLVRSVMMDRELSSTPETISAHILRFACAALEPKRQNRM